MECILFVGIPASGKSTFYAERYQDTHVRINLDMLRTRHRERLLFQACLDAKQPVVVDNTNVTRGERARYVAPAREARFRVTGFYFATDVPAALVRNGARTGRRRVPEKGLLGAKKRLEIPSSSEGFDALAYVTIEPSGAFVVEDWRDV